MKKWLSFSMMGLLFCGLDGRAFAHFAMIIPSDSMVMQDESKVVKVTLSFSHPFLREGMELDRPSQFGVVSRGWKKSLLFTLEETKVMGHRAWNVDYKITRPGVYTFYMESEPYWEPAEDRYIVRYTKTVIAAFGYEEDWGKPLGLKTEIVPLTRPFGLYAGNVFQGIVMLSGKPVPHAEVDVEYYNRNGKAVAPTDYMVTQVVKADRNGVFTYAAPRAGWWGFAALNTTEKMKYKGEEKDVELGAVLWVEFHDWREN
jgi:cobalt/nickel transport protein